MLPPPGIEPDFAVNNFVSQYLYRTRSSGCKVNDTVTQHCGRNYSIWHGEVGSSFMIVSDLDDYCIDRRFLERAENALFAILSRSALASTQSPLECLLVEIFPGESALILNLTTFTHLAPKVKRDRCISSHLYVISGSARLHNYEGDSNKKP
jgi:hypothetical protein